MTRLAGAVAMLALLVSGCGGSEPLADDPKGAEACSLLAGSLEADSDDAEGKLGGLFAAGEAAEEATTASIREATVDIVGQVSADTETMHAACVDAGVEMPDLP